MRVVAQITLGTGDVSSGSDEPGQVVALLHPPSVGRAARVTEQEHPRLSLGQCVRQRPCVADGPMGLQTDVAVRVDQSGQHPAGHRVHLSRQRPRETHPPVDDPQLIA